MGFGRYRWTLVLSALLVFSGAARAEGPGVMLGDRLVLHPGIAAEFRYDSNIFFQATNPVGEFLFRLMPSLDLATRPPQRGGNAPHGIDFRLHAGIDYNEYLTSDANVSGHRSVGVQAGMLLTVLPQHPFSFDVFDNYVRSVQPPYSLLPYNIDRDTNEAGLRLRYRPGGGRLQLDLAYTFGLDLFEIPQFQDLNVLYHRIDFRAMWKFFPKTAIYVEVSDQPYLYLHNGPGTIDHPDSYPLRAIAGLTGLITAKLTLNAWIGYGNGFYQAVAMTPTVNPNTPIGGIDLKWKPSVLSEGVIGYHHDFVNSLLGAYYDTDAAYIGWTQLIWRFTGAVNLQYSNNRYHGIQAATSLVPLARTDNLVVFNARVDYPFKDWLISSLGYVLQNNSTDAMLSMGLAGLVPLNYTTHEVYLRLSVLY